MTRAAGRTGPSRTPATLKTVPSFPWTTVSVVVRTSVASWVATRLLVSVARVLADRPLGPYLGMLFEIVLVSLVVGLTLFEIRRMNERVYLQDLGLSDLAVGAVSLALVLVCEILLIVTFANLTGS